MTPKSLQSTKLCDLSPASGTRASLCVCRKRVRAAHPPADAGDHGEKPPLPSRPGLLHAPPTPTPDSGRDPEEGRLG